MFSLKKGWQLDSLCIYIETHECSFLYRVHSSNGRRRDTHICIYILYILGLMVIHFYFCFFSFLHPIACYITAAVFFFSSEIQISTPIFQKCYAINFSLNFFVEFFFVFNFKVFWVLSGCLFSSSSSFFCFFFFFLIFILLFSLLLFHSNIYIVKGISTWENTHAHAHNRTTHDETKRYSKKGNIFFVEKKSLIMIEFFKFLLVF